MDLSILTDELRAVHDASLEMLAKTGIRFLLPEAVDILAGQGFKVAGDLVRFDEARLMDLVAQAPASFTMYGRDPGCEIFLGGGACEPAPAYGAPFISDAKGKMRPADMDDFHRMIKLHQACPWFKVNGGLPVQPSGVPLERLLFEQLRLTDKVMLTGAGSRQTMANMMAMLKIVFGQDLAAKPRVTTIVNSNSPMMFDIHMLETLLEFAAHGQPFALTGGGMAGAAGPMANAGSQAMANAERLAGIALAQALNPGTPILVGLMGSIMDMRKGSMAMGAPEFVLSLDMGAALARAYELPTRGGGALTDAFDLGAQSGYESMMTLMGSFNAGLDLIIHAAGAMQAIKSMSFEKLIVDFEMVGMMRRIRQGFTVDEDHLGVAALERVGPGGNFMLDPTTMQYCRSEVFFTDLALRGSVSGDPAQEYLNRVQAQLDKLSASYQQPALAPGIEAELQAFMAEKGIALD